MRQYITLEATNPNVKARMNTDTEKRIVSSIQLLPPPSSLICRCRYCILFSLSLTHPPFFSRSLHTHKHDCPWT